MKKTRDISEEDSALFREAIGDITPMKKTSMLHNKPEAKRKPKKQTAPSPSSQSLYDSEFEQNVLERGDELFFARPQVSNATLKKLRRGQIRIDEELDLHGMTVEMARKALQEFLTDCHDYSWQCVIIIHGKGIGSDSKKPILKNKVNNWLQQRNDVLAFCSARQADGGTGAIYLLLKIN
jgi:DNA-nicking Smr family endonuclease